MEDLNKTPLTHQVTAAAVEWLDTHGFKPIETEVQMPFDPHEESGWIADIAAVIAPTQTELIELKLLPRRPKRKSTRSEGDLSYEALMGTSDSAEIAWEEKREAILRRMTCLVEVKTSRSDFLKDRKWERRHPVDLAYLAVSEGVCRPEEWPKGWGVLEFAGGTIKQVRVPTPCRASTEQHLSTIYQIAIRRDHRTRYAEEKKDRQRERIEHQQRRFSALLGGVLSLLEARREVFELDLHMSGLWHAELPEWTTAQLRELWEKARALRVLSRTPSPSLPRPEQQIAADD